MSRSSAFLFDADGHDRPVDLTADVVKGLGKRKLLWVDLDRTAPEADALAGRIDELLGLEVREIQHEDSDAGHPKLRRTEDRLHLTVEALETDDAHPPGLVRREIDLVGGENVVISVHEGGSQTFDRFRAGLEGETRLGVLTAGDLLSSLVDAVLDGYFLVVELIEKQIDDLDQRALHDRRGDDVLNQIVALRRRIGLVRRTLAPHRRALSTLALPEMSVAEAVGRPWPGLIDRLDSAIEATEGLRESLLGTFDIHMGRVSQRANDVMRTLTILSAVLLPAVVLAGIMGMNFKLPFFDTDTNFWVVIGGMVAFAAGILGVARWRGWL